MDLVFKKNSFRLHKSHDCMTLCSGRSLSRMYDDQRENLMVKIMINMQRKHITTFLTYESHVEPQRHLLKLVVDAAARPRARSGGSSSRCWSPGSGSSCLLRSLSRRRRFLSPSRSLSPPSSGTMGVAATNRVKQYSREY